MKRYFMAFIGVILIGFNVTLLNLSGFGVDTFSCMNMAVSEHLPFSYGVWQIIVNIVIFIGLFIFVIKEKKGISAVSYTHLDVYKRQVLTFFWIELI